MAIILARGEPSRYSALEVCFPLVPKLRLGTHSTEPPFPRRTPRRHCSAPIGNHLRQSRLARIVAGAGITPMDRIIDVAALDRIVVNVVELLVHHFVVADLLGFAALFPNLVLTFSLVTQLEGA